MDPLLLIAPVATLALIGGFVALDNWIRGRAWRDRDNDRAVELAAWRDEWLVGVPDPYGTIPTSEHSDDPPESLYAILGVPHARAVKLSEIREHETLSLSPREHLG